MLLDRAVRNPCPPAHNIPAIARFERRGQFVAITIAEFRPAQDLAPCARPFEASFRPLTDLFALELCQRGKSCEQDVPDELVLRRQMLFSERAECDTMRGEALKVSNRSRHALAAEAVE